MKALLIILVALAVCAAAFIAYVILNNPSAEDHEIATTLYRSVMEKYDFGDKLSFTPHPSKVFLKIKGAFNEEEKAEISTEIRGLAEELNINKKVVIDFGGG